MIETMKVNDGSKIDIEKEDGSSRIQINIHDTLTEVLFFLTPDETIKLSEALKRVAKDN